MRNVPYWGYSTKEHCGCTFKWLPLKPQRVSRKHQSIYIKFEPSPKIIIRLAFNNIFNIYSPNSSPFFQDVLATNIIF